jgi:tetratricopeptide (TPR) repeat protein
MNMGRSDTWMQQGKHLFASGKYDEAIKFLNRVIQKDPEDAEAWMFKGRVLYYQRKYMDALRCHEKAANCDCKNESFHSGIIQCCDKLIEIDEKNIEAFNIKIEALINQGKYEDALEICDSKFELNLKNAPRVWNWKGDALRRQNMQKSGQCWAWP